MPRAAEPWGVDEIASALELKRATVYYHIARGSFPPAWAELAMGRVWRSTDVLEWRRRQTDKGVPDEE